MKTQTQLEDIGILVYDALEHGHQSNAIKLLRSIELDAWREARELVEERCNADCDFNHIDRAGSLAEMDRVIQQLQLK